MPSLQQVYELLCDKLKELKKNEKEWREKGSNN